MVSFPETYNDPLFFGGGGGGKGWGGGGGTAVFLNLKG